MLFLHEQVTRTIVLAPSLGSSIVSFIFAQHHVDFLFIHRAKKALYPWLDLTLFTKHIPLINLIISQSLLPAHDTRLLSARPNTLREYHRYKSRLPPPSVAQRHRRLPASAPLPYVYCDAFRNDTGTTAVHAKRHRASVPPGVASAQ